MSMPAEFACFLPLQAIYRVDALAIVRRLLAAATEVFDGALS
jgi:hypothetical protein